MFITIIKNIFYFWKSITILAIILYLSFAPPSTFKGIPVFSYEDKLVHAFMYLVLSGMLVVDYRRSKLPRSNKLSYFIICIILPAFLGGMVEIVQPVFFAPRTASWLDWLADLLGIGIGLFMAGKFTMLTDKK